ncbi:MAG: GNAT family N-acetyltransferase, partial [Pseudomonadota bacterium]
MEFNGCDFRQATSADGHELLRVQRRAIHTIDRAFYALRELESWATGLTPEGYGLCIAEGEEIEVAVDGSDRITGFSSRMDGAILGLFVDPSAQGRGLGAALLSRAEEGLIDGGARSS